MIGKPERGICNQISQHHMTLTKKFFQRSFGSLSTELTYSCWAKHKDRRPGGTYFPWVMLLIIALLPSCFVNGWIQVFDGRFLAQKRVGACLFHEAFWLVVGVDR